MLTRTATLKAVPFLQHRAPYKAIRRRPSAADGTKTRRSTTPRGPVSAVRSDDERFHGHAGDGTDEGAEWTGYRGPKRRTAGHRGGQALRQALRLVPPRVFRARPFL